MTGSLLRSAGLVLCLMAGIPAMAQETDPPRPIVSEIVENVSAQLRSFPGVIAAEVQTTLAFQTSGRVAERYVELGDRVTAGQSIAVLDQVTLQEDVDAAQAGVAAAAAQAELAQQSFDRVTELRRRGVASDAQIEAITAQRDASDAALTAAKADLTRAQDAAQFGTLVAPADGIIIAVHADPGSMVTPGTPVVTLATDEGREAVFDVPEDVRAILDDGSEFIIEPRYETDQVWHGSLRLIEPIADSGTRGHRLHVTLDDQTLRLGTLITARLDLPETPVLTLPEQAIVMIDDAPHVWRVGPERRAELVAVTLGERLDLRWIVEAGLTAGDEVLIRGTSSVEEGQTLGERVE